MSGNINSYDLLNAVTMALSDIDKGILVSTYLSGKDTSGVCTVV